MVSRAKRASETASGPDPDESADEVEEIADTIEEQAGELENVDFPTMFG